jgi:hypothetical protein
VIVAETLQKVFMILVRPYFVVDGEKYFHAGKIYNDPGQFIPEHYDSIKNQTVPDQFIPGILLETNNENVQPNSPQKLNSSAEFLRDPWFLHSTYTSYDDYRMAVKDLLAIYGFDNIKCSTYIPMDFIPLPKEKKKRRKDL